MANKHQAFGLDAELEAKKAAKHDPKMEAEALLWIKELTALECGSLTTHEFLKSGVVLCKLMNVLRPGIVAKVNESKMAFKQALKRSS